MGTQIQEVFDAFFIKLLNVDFTGKEAIVYQIFKSSIPHCIKTVPEDLIYTFDESTYTGIFNDVLGCDSIELIALAMVCEYYFKELGKLSGRKQYLGTQAFNKIPDLKDELNATQLDYNEANEKFEKFRQEFYSYTN